MENLELPPDPRDIKKVHPAQTESDQQEVHFVAPIDKEIIEERKRPWYAVSREKPQNVSETEAGIRFLCVFLLPGFSAIDWYLHTHTIFFIVPLIYYLEVTAFTQYCPIKRLFTNYTIPTKIE